MPASPKKSAERSLLSQVSKQARDTIDRIKNEKDGKLSLREFLGKYWDLSAPGRFGLDDQQMEGVLKADRRDAARLRPDWSPEQVDVAVRLAHISAELKEVTIARRVVLDDPGELARGLAILNRFDHLIGSGPQWQQQAERVLDVCASGNIEHARQLVEGRTCWDRAIISPKYLHMDVVYAMLRGDSSAVSRLMTQVTLQKGSKPWLQGIYIALSGASENRADEVARGLQMHLIGVQKTQQRPDLDGAVNLCAHGLYRLLRWANADLVSQFDVRQPFPWDAAFHDWVDAHPNPLADLELTSTSLLLHDLIVHGKIPSWLEPRPGPRYEIVLLGGDPKSGELLDVIERCSQGDRKSAKALLAHAPCPLVWNLRKDAGPFEISIDQWLRDLERAGGQAEVREMTPNQFRFFIPDERETPTLVNLTSPAPPKKSAKKPLLSQIGKNAREEIDRIMNERDGKLSLREYLEKYWDLGASWRSPFTDDREVEKLIKPHRAEGARRRPDWSPEQVDIDIRLWQISMDLKNVAIARRVVLDDPGELARGLAILNRLGRVIDIESRVHWDRRESVFNACASGDLEHARWLVEGRSCGSHAVISGETLHMDVVFGMLQRDPSVVNRLVAQFALQKKSHVRPWLEGIYIALRGASENRADEVARGLQMHLIGLHKMQDKRDLDGAINLWAHGLYRLLRWMNTDLVSRFDAGQPFPWDAAFHDWVDAHPNPLADLDLTGISPVLHDLVVHGRVQSWLEPLPEPLYEIVLLGGDPKSPELLEEIEQCSCGDRKSAKALLARAPCTLVWNLRKDDGIQIEHGLLESNINQYLRRIEQAGGQAEVREMAPNQFRFFIPDEVR